MNDAATRLESTAVELRSISDQLARQHQRVAALAEPFVGGDHDDVVTALHEAERQLTIAQRTVDRSVRSITGRH